MSNIPERSWGEREILLKNIDGQLLPATVNLGCRDWNEKNGRRTECRITLRWAGGQIECIDSNFFESFKQVRKLLTGLSLLPMCYGASRNIVVTGMLLDMGLGMKIYREGKLNTFPTRKSLIDLFAGGEDIEPVSVEEQEEFRREWLDSVRVSAVSSD
jgi:hypothetical protein